MIIVAGITRSGLSLTMQMIDAGGFPCAGEYPGYEPYPLFEIPWAYLPDKIAVKVVDTHMQLPPIGNYKIIRLHRDMEQQARSTIKLMNHAFPSIKADQKTIAALVNSYSDDYQVIDDWAKNYDCLHIHFEDLINKSFDTAYEIGVFINENMDINKMSDCVVDRKTDCYPTLLELDLLK